MKSGRRARSGLSILELMISLAISAMLLTAVAAAFTASTAAIEANDQFFRATQAARVCLNQILTEVRRAHAVAVTTGRIDMITFDGYDRSYSYDSTNKLIKLITNDDLLDADYALARSVIAANFQRDQVQGDDGLWRTVRVNVTLTVQVDDNVVRLSGSSAPRREQGHE